MRTKGDVVPDLVDYLATPRAVEDVRALLAGGPHFSLERAMILGDLQCYKSGAWTCVRTTSPVVQAYFRPDGDRFIVTDMGEAVRALRLRTGALDAEPIMERVVHRVGWRDEFDRPAGLTTCPGDVLRTFNPCVNGEGMYTVHILAIPAAICCVLLAACNVANTDVP